MNKTNPYHSITTNKAIIIILISHPNLPTKRYSSLKININIVPFFKLVLFCLILNYLKILMKQNKITPAHLDILYKYL